MLAKHCTIPLQLNTIREKDCLKIFIQYNDVKYKSTSLMSSYFIFTTNNLSFSKAIMYMFVWLSICMCSEAWRGQRGWRIPWSDQAAMSCCVGAGIKPGFSARTAHLTSGSFLQFHAFLISKVWADKM